MRSLGFSFIFPCGVHETLTYTRFVTTCLGVGRCVMRVNLIIESIIEGRIVQEMFRL